MIEISLTVGSWDHGQLVAHPPAGGVCTADYGSTQMMLAIDPKLVDVHSRLTIATLHGRDAPTFSFAAPLRG